ncbi:MAG: AglZ/HisF2 family acetamidino modification protein [bacterium]|nr:AglZ/HisF2 family acetamidino modification protein [bacterium]
MLRTRIIPCLLLRNGGLVKTVKFKNPTYLGDPINAVRIFNEKEVDEIVFLDITATVENRGPSIKVLTDIASECFMPLAYGGGVRNLEDARAIFDLGVEKVVLNSAAFENPKVIEDIAAIFGNQAVVVSIDVKKSLFGKYSVYTRSASKDTSQDPVSYAKKAVEHGAGEIFLNSIDRDGTGSGYDLSLVQRVCEVVPVPVVACGGAASVSDLVSVVSEGGAAAASAGSLFVFHGKHRAVLINFPARALLEQSFSSVA